MPGLDPRALRRLNTSVTLRTLAISAEPVTMAMLAERTGLSRRTLELILDALVEAGWVEELPRESTAGGAGRPARRFELRAEHSLLAAVRITTLAVTAVVADARGRIIGRVQRPLEAYPDPARTLDAAAALVLEAIEDAGASVDRLRAGAIASGGAIDERGVVRRLVHAARWVGTDLPAELSARIPVPWFADNDANLGALGERWRGAARDHDDVAWVILGSRAGVGVLIRGTVHRGLEGAAGEIVEAASLDAASFDGRRVGGLSSPVAEERQAALAVFAAARAGDAGAVADVDAFTAHIAGILTTLSWTIAPSLIVIGGGLEDGGDLLLPRLRHQLRSARAPGIELRETVLGVDGPLIGALKFVLDRMDTQLFGPVVPDG